MNGPLSQPAPLLGHPPQLRKKTNGVVERWNRTLKEQAVYGRVFRNLAEVLAEFVVRYNQCRLEKLAYRTPLEAREEYKLAKPRSVNVCPRNRLQKPRIQTSSQRAADFVDHPQDRNAGARNPQTHRTLRDPLASRMAGTDRERDRWPRDWGQREQRNGRFVSPDDAVKVIDGILDGRIQGALGSS